MSHGLSESGQATALVLVGLVVLAIPAGLALAQGLTESSAASDTATVVTPTLPPVNLTETPTPTSTPTPKPEGDDNNTDGNPGTGQTHFVNTGGVADGVTSDEECTDANYTTIQSAIDDAAPGDTVVVCSGTYHEQVKVTTANLTIRANGDAAIKNSGASVVWINATGVTLRDFDISADAGADYAIEVGGKKTVIRDNTVDSSGVGIFLSDGRIERGECNHLLFKECDDSPPVDPELGAAIQGRVVNNTISADHIRIWVDADQTVVQNNIVTNRQPIGDQSKISQQAQPGHSSTTGHEDAPYCQGCETYNHSIVSSGNETVIGHNTIQQSDPGPPGTANYHEAGIQIGKTPRKGHNSATNNLVVNNVVAKPGGRGIKLRGFGSYQGAAGTIVQDNTVNQAHIGAELYDGVVLRNNTFRNRITGVHIWGFNETGKEALVINNTIADRDIGRAIQVRDNAKVIGNKISNPIDDGIVIICNKLKNGSVLIANNEITGPGQAGIEVGCTDGYDKIGIKSNKVTNSAQYGIYIRNQADATQVEIHNNLINNNQDLGIYNVNISLIVDATDNIWGCGGPSSGFNPLADPYTGRLANGSGDAISAGNDSTQEGHPISNVHFDPFLELGSCSSDTPNPTQLQPKPNHRRRPRPHPPIQAVSGPMRVPKPIMVPELKETVAAQTVVMVMVAIVMPSLEVQIVTAERRVHPRPRQA